MMIVKGVNVFPSQIEAVLLNQGYPANYQIIVTVLVLPIPSVCWWNSRRTNTPPIRQRSPLGKAIWFRA